MSVLTAWRDLFMWFWDIRGLIGSGVIGVAHTEDVADVGGAKLRTGSREQQKGTSKKYGVYSSAILGTPLPALRTSFKSPRVQVMV